MKAAFRFGLTAVVCALIAATNVFAFQTIPATVTAGAAPDNNNLVLSNLIDGAKESIQFTGYMLRSTYLGERLEAAAKRGVSVVLLLDGWPVAKSRAQKIDKQDLWIADRIVRAGGKVYYMASDRGDRADRRYKYLHAKYAIFDGESVYITSENFAQNSGHSVNRSIGNRGWAIAIKNKDLAAQYAAVFHKDLNLQSSDIVAFGTAPAYSISDRAFTPDSNFKTGTYQPYDALTFSDSVGVEKILAPENTMENNSSIIGSIKRAASYVKIQNLSFSPHWGKETDTAETHPSPIVEALLSAARRGVAVRVMLQPLFHGNPSQPAEPPTGGEDGEGAAAFQAQQAPLTSLPFFQIKSMSGGRMTTPHTNFRESTRDNKSLITYLRDIAAKESLDIKAHFFWTKTDEIVTLNNKGMVVDGDETLISSVNWVENSMKNNRELGILVKSKQVGEYYEGLFETDWRYRRNYK